MGIKNYLREVLYNLGITQAQLADEVGLSRQQVSNIMNGKSSITQELMEFLHCKYDVNINYLLFGKGNMFNVKSDELVSSLNKKLEEFPTFSSKLYFLIDYFNRKPNISEERLAELIYNNKLPTFYELNEIKKAYSVSMDVFVSDEEAPKVFAKLTEREESVLMYLSNGLTNKEIAEQMNVTSHTVKAHVSAILRKLDSKSRIEAVIKYQKSLKNGNV